MTSNIIYHWVSKSKVWRGLVIYSPKSFDLFPLLDTSFLSTGRLSPLLDSAVVGEALAMAGGLSGLSGSWSSCTKTLSYYVYLSKTICFLNFSCVDQCIISYSPIKLFPLIAINLKKPYINTKSKRSMLLFQQNGLVVDSAAILWGRHFC